MLAEQDMSIEVSGEVKKELADLGYNPELGARPLRRVIEEQIEDKIAEFYLNHEKVSDMYADLIDGEIVVMDKTDEDQTNTVSADQESDNQ